MMLLLMMLMLLFCCCCIFELRTKGEKREKCLHSQERGRGEGNEDKVSHTWYSPHMFRVGKLPVKIPKALSHFQFEVSMKLVAALSIYIYRSLCSNVVQSVLTSVQTRPPLSQIGLSRENFFYIT